MPFRPAFADVSVARFSKTLATLLAAGVPLLKAMDIVRNVLGNALWRRWWKRRPARSARGEKHRRSPPAQRAIPAHRHAMIAVGEKSGQLEQMLESVAEAYDAQVETNVQALNQFARAPHDRGDGRPRSASFAFAIMIARLSIPQDWKKPGVFFVQFLGEGGGGEPSHALFWAPIF